MPSMRTTLGAGGAVSAAIALVAPFIMHWEGLETHEYPDVGGIRSVCYGHTGNDISLTHTYTPAECYAILVKDMTNTANGVIKVSPQLTQPQHQNELAAVISFSYNVGVGNYTKGIAPLFNKGDYVDGCKALLKYDYAGGVFYRKVWPTDASRSTYCLYDTR